MHVQKKKPKRVRVFEGTGDRSCPGFFLWRGKEIEDLRTFTTRDARCEVCGKEAFVIVAQFEQSTKGAPAVQFPTKLGTRCRQWVPSTSSRLAALCTLCGRTYHLACIENVTMNDIAFYYCPRCQRELGPALWDVEKKQPQSKEEAKRRGYRDRARKTGFLRSP